MGRQRKNISFVGRYFSTWTAVTGYQFNDGLNRVTGLTLRLSSGTGAEGGEGATLFVVGIVNGFAVVVEDHGGPMERIENRPVR